MRKLTLIILAVGLSLQAKAASTCTIKYSQKIMSDTIDGSAKERIKIDAIATLSDRPALEIVEDSTQADYLVDISALTNMDMHNANNINAIAHLSISTAKDARLFSYSMHFGRWNYWGNRKKAYSESNFNRSVQVALNEIGNCDDLARQNKASRDPYPNH